MLAKPRSGGATGLSLWVHSASAVFAKEARIEWRSRHALGTTLLFTVSTLAAMAFVLAQKAVGTDVKAALLWIVLLFAALTGLARAFVREEELGTADALRLSAVSSAVYAGKLAFNLLLLLLVEAIATPLFLAVLPIPPGEMNIGLLVAVLFLGGVGLAAAATFIAALVAQTSAGGGRGALFFIVAFPVLMPCLMAGVGGTLGAFAPLAVPAQLAHNNVVMLVSYDVVVVAAAFALFSSIWEA